MTISVIIPTRLRPDLLARALRSVFAQTLPPLEVIVVIDGPDPATAALLAAWPDPRLFVLQTSGLGAGAARNLAAGAARGTWLAFLDDDDEWAPEKLAQQRRAAAPGRIVSCRSLAITPAGAEPWPRVPYGGGAVDDYLFDRRTLFRGRTHIGTSTLLVPAALFAKTGFSADRQNEDTVLLLRATKQAGANLVMLPDTLVTLHKTDSTSLGHQYDWRVMLRWADRMGSLLTPRAYSGFCLIYLGSQAARQRDWRGLGTLLWRAFSRGRPRAMHIVPFLAFWCVPPSIRHRARGALASKPRPVSAAAR